MPSESSRPYLTIVGWTRNDGYTPRYDERIKKSVGLLVRQLERHQLPSELVIVEWNPPPDRPLMATLLGLPDRLENVTVRFITVGPEYHQRYRGWQERGIHSVECVNVGKRRARGRFVTVKPLDNFFSDALIARIAQQDLLGDCVYRCDRCDVQLDGLGWLDLSDEELFAAMKHAPLQRHGRLEQSPQWKIRDLHTNACGDFTLMSLERWHQIRGYFKDPTVLGLDADSIALHAAAAHGAREVCWPSPCDIYKIVHGNINALRLSTVWKPWQTRLEQFFLKRGMHNHAHRARVWFDYPRRHVRGIDSVLGPSIERNFVARAERFARGDVSEVLNDENWGLGDVTLPDRYVTRAAWDAA